MILVLWFKSSEELIFCCCLGYIKPSTYLLNKSCSEFFLSPPWSKILNLSHESPQKRPLLQKMVRHPTCMILSNKLGHTEYGWRDALCTPVLLGLLQGRLPRRLGPGRRARLQKVHWSLLLQTQTLLDATPPVRKIYSFSKIAVTFEPIQQFWCP